MGTPSRASRDRQQHSRQILRHDGPRLHKSHIIRKYNKTKKKLREKKNKPCSTQRKVGGAAAGTCPDPLCLISGRLTSRQVLDVSCGSPLPSSPRVTSTPPTTATQTNTPVWSGRVGVTTARRSVSRLTSATCLPFHRPAWVGVCVCVRLRRRVWVQAEGLENCEGEPGRTV